MSYEETAQPKSVGIKWRSQSISLSNNDIFSGLLSSANDDSEVLKISLPSIEHRHLKRAIKFLYTGQIKVTRAEIENDHFLYYLNYILRELFRLDASINLPSRYLQAPTSNNEDNDQEPPSSRDNNNPGDGHGNDPGNNNTRQTPSNYSFLFSSKGCDVQDTRQNAAQGTTIMEETSNNNRDDETVLEESIQTQRDDGSAGILEDIPVTSGNDEERLGNSLQTLGNFEATEEYVVIETTSSETHEEEVLGETYHFDPLGNDEEILGEFEVDVQDYANLHDSNIEEDIIEIEHKVPTPDIVDLLYSDDENLGDGETNQLKSVWNLSPERETPMDVTTDNSQEENQRDVLSNLGLIPNVNVDQQPSNQNDRPKVEASKIRKKKNKNSNTGVRKHHHIPWTMSGLKRASTEAVIKEESSEYECEICGIKYDKQVSLRVHMGRAHNQKSTVACPEGCGKMLTSHGAVKKHLLSHRPEKEWPYECPICHKKFQARGDIPKHLKTKLHENDNIPVMGTKGWYDLVYHDDPTYDYQQLKIKLEKLKNKQNLQSESSTISSN